MQEPFRSRFVALLRRPAATHDIHDLGRADDPDPQALADAYVERELGRVDLHRRRLLPLLAKVGRAPRILDFGCGTGGTTVALALSASLAPISVIGVDVNRSAIAAAKVRATAYAVRSIASFRAIEPGPLPFGDGEFDLAVAVSVFEFITDTASRRRAVEALARVVRPGGFVFIAIPRPSVREYHTGCWLGDLRRPRARPWSSSTRELLGWLPRWKRHPLHDELAMFAREHAFGDALLRFPSMRALLPWMTRWNKLLLQRPGESNTDQRATGTSASSDSHAYAASR